MSLLSFTKRITGRDSKAAPAKAKTATKTKAKGATKPETKAPAKPTEVHQVIRAGVIGLVPLISEKSVNRQSEANVVTFRVRPSATKGQIMSAVFDRYKVQPIRIRTMHVMPKRRTRGQSIGRTNSWKKAYVTLPAGKSIDLSI